MAEEYIKKTEAEEYLSQPITMSTCLSVEECKTRRRQQEVDILLLRAIPAADVVPVVRCKDCKYCLQTDEFEYWCNGFCNPARIVRKEDFCSHGAKMGGET